MIKTIFSEILFFILPANFDSSLKFFYPTTKFCKFKVQTSFFSFNHSLSPLNATLTHPMNPSWYFLLFPRAMKSIITFSMCSSFILPRKAQGLKSYFNDFHYESFLHNNGWENDFIMDGKKVKSFSLLLLPFTGFKVANPFCVCMHLMWRAFIDHWELLILRLVNIKHAVECN